MLNDIETTAMGMLLAGEHPVLAVLRDQLAVAEVANREFSGAGFFVFFRVPASSSRVDERRLVIGDVYAELTVSNTMRASCSSSETVRWTTSNVSS
jgi:hypothetical protein